MNSSWLTLLLTRELAAFSRELDLFPTEAQIWATVPGIANPAGSLSLHVCGNLQHYVGAVLGGTGYVRDREREFSARDVARSVLQAEIVTTTAVVNAVVPALTEERLLAAYPHPVGDVTLPTGLFLCHLSAHLAHHLGQMGYLRRAVMGENSGSSGALAIRELVIDGSSPV